VLGEDQERPPAAEQLAHLEPCQPAAAEHFGREWLDLWELLLQLGQSLQRGRIDQLVLADLVYEGGRRVDRHDGHTSGPLAGVVFGNVAGRPDGRASDAPPLYSYLKS